LEEQSRIKGVKDTAHLSYSGTKINVTTPYNAGFVAQLKAGTTSRRWNPDKKVWSVDVKEREKLLEITGQFFQIVEDGQTEKSTSAEAAVALPATELGNIDLILKPGAELEIWADGACSTNPGPGGYGIVFKYQGKMWGKSGGFRLTTNNRMEIMGVIAALETLPDNCRVTFLSDSQYVVNSLTKGWAKSWKARGWKKKDNKPVPNADLWDRLLDLCVRHDIAFKWIKGHDGTAENERCDEMAVAVYAKHNLPVDKGYKKIESAD